jgi:hypothetical protein
MRTQKCAIIIYITILFFWIVEYFSIEDQLTFNSKVQWLAARLIHGVRCCADIVASTASRHTLQNEALIRPDDPRRRVMRQDLILQRKRFQLKSTYCAGENETLAIPT